MEFLENLVLSGRIIDIAIMVMATELVVLMILKQRGRITLDAIGAVYNLGAGGSLALAIKSAVTSEDYLMISAFLIASLVFHSLDTYRRIGRPVPK